MREAGENTGIGASKRMAVSARIVSNKTNNKYTIAINFKLSEGAAVSIQKEQQQAGVRLAKRRASVA